MSDFNALPMILSHCPICRTGPKLNYSDVKHCPLFLAKFKGEIVSPEDFARKYRVVRTSPKVEPKQTAAGQFELF
jgi:hypothetical protein